jgi:hypothetical protein
VKKYKKKPCQDSRLIKIKREKLREEGKQEARQNILQRK